ncbi:MAG TPA: DHH family phosphoesterase, partial [Anaerolineaceae bacterium]
MSGVEKVWRLLPEVYPPERLLQAAGGNRIVAQVLCRRGIQNAVQAHAFLDPDSYQPTSPFELPGMGAAADRLGRAVRNQERVCVWGDFDVDGQTSTTVLVAGLRALGGRVSYHIPVRGPESHGISLAVLGEVIAGGAQLILTCDTGIAAHDAVNFAHSRGVEVIITDHHELPEKLPGAEHILTPRLLPADHPLASLPGVGVAYKLVEALYQRFGCPGAENFQDLAALGIVADLAALRG